MPRSVHGCDTFVVLPTLTADACVIFGKNSDRPSDEVQEVIYVAATDCKPGSKLQCTYIEIDQTAHTHAVVLSKPSWMWGAEMGANEHGVVIGNEAVWTKLNDFVEDSEERLLGMDLLRLGLERGSTARQCLDVITTLLEMLGQGGPCSEDDPSMTYHNSFLIVDRKAEAWVLETAGRYWVAEKVEGGYRHISNNLTITSKIDLIGANVKEHAKEKGWWDGSEPFNFSKTYGKGDDPRQKSGDELLVRYTSSKKFGPVDMMNILRDKRSGICMGLGGGFVSTGSQVSVLTDPGKKAQCLHFLTGTPDPSISSFKPFVFANGMCGSHFIESPKISPADDPVKTTPRFQKKIDRRHILYKLHESAFGLEKSKTDQIVAALRQVEEQSVGELLASLRADQKIVDGETLFKDAVEAETRIFKNAMAT